MTECRWCGMIHGARCPSVKVLEFFENGMIKRVEFVTPRDMQVSLATGLPIYPLPATPSPVWPSTLQQPRWEITSTIVTCDTANDLRFALHNGSPPQ